VPVLLKIVLQSRNDTLRAVALSSLQAYNDPAIGKQVVEAFAGMPEEVRTVAQSVLASRPNWSQLLVEAVDAGKIEPRTITDDTVRRFLLHDSPRIREICQKHWDVSGHASLDDVRREIDRLTDVLAKGAGNPYQGKKLFSQSCGKCHVLFADGGKIGPNLTTFKRDDLRGMLLNVVQPGAEIREGFENYLVRTADGRTLSGLIVDQDAQLVVLRGADGNDVPLAREEIEDMRAVPLSLMPEGILKPFSEQQLRDLFAYLRSTQPLP
jgi:putative heme-binding domain-containing protein